MPCAAPACSTARRRSIPFQEGGGRAGGLPEEVERDANQTIPIPARSRAVAAPGVIALYELARRGT